MAMDLARMLERCTQGQWCVDDFDWTGTPVPLSPEQERQVCAYYVDMSYIERLAGALFLSLSRRVSDPMLAAIYRSFHADEVRHSQAAARLADYFDVHHYEVYTPNLPMLRFIPSFVRLVESLHPAFANSLILGGELILDMALLRSLNGYVDDPLSRAVVERINQDESRHLAVDMYLSEVLAGAGHGIIGGASNPWLEPDWWGVLTWAPGFFGEVFFRPMQVLDPSQLQMQEVMRRFRRFYDRHSLDGNPAVEQWRGFVDFFESTIGATIGTAVVDGIRRLWAIDLSFVYVGSSAALYGGCAPERHAAPALAS